MMKKIRFAALIAASSFVLVPSAFAQWRLPQVLRNPEVSIAYPESSREHVAETAFVPNPPKEHPVRPLPRHGNPHNGPDPALQPFTPFMSMPSTLLNFFGQGSSYDGLNNTSPGSTTTGDPPDTNGAVGPNHYVQAVNAGYVVFNKVGTQLQAPRFINNLWTGYTGTNAGNNCANRNDGDPVVMYDALADRWFITQFSLPNYLPTTQTPPSFQCVAVSKTGDPAGAYWLYDFSYPSVVNDYGKFAVWPDAYYATFNNFSATAFLNGEMCAYDRASMLAGLPASQQCFTTVFDGGILPTSLEGSVPPPLGRTELFVSLNTSTSLNTYRFHVDWTTPANSTLTGPTVLTVPAYGVLCPTTGTCILQPSPGNQLDSLSDRLMYRATYRNFGTHESVVVNHSVPANSTAGLRWYEIRTPGGTPTLFQSGTYAPNDGNYRWMGSMAQDQAQGMALGFSVSGSTTKPSIAWTGRLATDLAGVMGQAETVVHSGLGVESGTFGSGTPATRWGDYSSMTVDPSDDCTFWYTTEDFPANGHFNWDTRIATVKFPNCGANNFSIGLSPSLQLAAPGGAGVTYTVSTPATAGTPESIALNIQDLPSGVTASFSPATVTAGSSSTLTLTAGSAAPLTASAATFTVIGKAASAVHRATAQVSVTTAATPVPTNVVAIASGDGSQVGISWTAVAGATYEVYRRGPTSHDAFAGPIGTPSTNSFTDTAVTGLAANNAYLYRVRAVIGGVSSVDSASGLATTVAYTDDPITAGTTFVKAEHLTQLRTAITAVAGLAGTTFSFTDVITSSTTPMKSVHVTELRTALDAARLALGLTALTYANSAAPNNVAHGADFMELRNGMR